MNGRKGCRSAKSLISATFSFQNLPQPPLFAKWRLDHWATSAVLLMIPTGRGWGRPVPTSLQSSGSWGRAVPTPYKLASIGVSDSLVPMKLNFRRFGLELAHRWTIARGLEPGGGGGTTLFHIVLLELIDKDGVVGLGEAAPSARY